MSGLQAPSFPQEPPAELEPKRRKGAVLGAAGLVVVLVAGLLVFQFTRPNDRASASLALSFKEGDTARYRLHMTMDGAMSSDLTGTEQVVMDFSETFSWKVTKVDPDGIATIEVTIEDVSGTANGLPVPATGTGMTSEMRIAPDGRVLSAGDLMLAASNDSGGTGFPGMGQITPILPDHPVAPGDTWSKDFSQSNPFGDGDIRFSTQSSFDRYEDVNGVKAAVITSTITVPLDLTFDFGKLMAAYGGDSPQSGMKELRKVKITYGGQGSFVLTSWVDLAAEQMVKSSSTGDFDLTMEFSGIPDIPPGTRFGLNVNFTQELERL